MLLEQCGLSNQTATDYELKLLKEGCMQGEKESSNSGKQSRNRYGTILGINWYDRQDLQSRVVGKYVAEYISYKHA